MKPDELDKLKAETLCRQVHAVITMAEIPLPLAGATLMGVLLAIHRMQGRDLEGLLARVRQAWAEADKLDAARGPGAFARGVTRGAH